MTRYRFHDSLGGGEHEATTDHTIGTVGFKFPGIEEIVYIPRRVLTEVKPPLPPEPEGYTTVLAMIEGVEAACRRLGNWWWTASADSNPRSWEQLCEHSEPVLLVPEKPAEKPVELPLIRATNTEPYQRRIVRVDRRGGHVGLEITAEGRLPNTYRASLKPYVATEVARALDAAAKEAEGTVS
jgi:hypothetical protein